MTYFHRCQNALLRPEASRASPKRRRLSLLAKIGALGCGLKRGSRCQRSAVVGVSLDPAHVRTRRRR